MVQRVGFCQYYASAMITMLRSLGIPARLVVGFAPGTRDTQRGGWLVRAENYHAWPEVYFPGHGWVEFEPTPAAVQPSLEAFRTGPEPSPLGSPVMDGESAPIDSCDDQALLCDELAQLDVPPSDIPVSVPEPQPANQPWWIAWFAAAGTAAYGIVLLRRREADGKTATTGPGASLGDCQLSAGAGDGCLLGPEDFRVSLSLR